MNVTGANHLSGKPEYRRNIACGCIPVALFVYVCIEYLDRPVSMLVVRYLYRNEIWARHTSSLPDLLLLTVLFTTTGAYALFKYRVRHGSFDNTTLSCKLLACVAPLSYVAKSILKFVFGRINTRQWLLTPDYYDFYWFQGGDNHSGFPSGHMLVFTALTAVMWRMHPRFRNGYVAFLLVLGLAMIATNYHFVSDVVAGAYLGFLIEVCMWKFLTSRDRNVVLLQGVAQFTGKRTIH